MLTKLTVTVSPRHGQLAPKVTVSVPGQSVSVLLHESQKLNFEFENSKGWIEIDFCNKPAMDQQMAVVIDEIAFFGISSDKFAWAGLYYPRYPEPWLSEQDSPPPISIPQQTYLGWNGRWRLDFTVPVFTWIHQTLNLGWLYQ